MNFSNIIFFRFPVMPEWTFASQMVEEGGTVERKPSLLHQGAEHLRAKPPGPMEMASSGFVAPFGAASPTGAITEMAGEDVLITIEFSKKILPPTVVMDALQKRCEEHEAKTGRRPGGKAGRQYKDDVIAELLPRALVARKRVDALIFPGLGLIAVDTASRRVAESVVSHVREALGSFPAVPIFADVPASAVMTGWLSGDEMPAVLHIGHDCTLEDPAGGGGKVTVKELDLASEEITGHLAAGRQATRLALRLNEISQFTLHHDHSVRRFKLGDASVAMLESNDRDDLQAELDARLLVLAGAIKFTFGALDHPFRIQKAA